MSYTPDVFADGLAGNTPITAAKLNKLGQGLQTATDKADSAVQPAVLDATVEAERTLQSQTYAVRGGNRYLAEGDSTAQGAVDNTNRALGEAWPVLAAMKAQQRLTLVGVRAVAGNASAAVLTRLPASLSETSPRIVTLNDGTNDIGAGVSLATWLSNKAAQVALVRAAGALPVLSTIPPRDAGGFEATINLWNHRLRAYALTEGLTVMDFYRALVDPATGRYLTGYTSDGVHPTGPGLDAMSDVAAQVLAGLVPSGAPLLPQDNIDANNLIPNGLFITDTNADGVPDGLTPGSAPTGVTSSLVADAAVPGKLFRLSATASSGVLVYSTANVTTGFTVGQRVACVGLISADGGVSYTVRLKFNGASSSSTPVSALTRPLTGGVFYQESVVPTGTTSMSVEVQIGAGTGRADFGQLGLFNLTTIGA